MKTFYEFFAGGGMARAGIGNGWQCLFSNDFDHKKASAYRKNWGDAELKVSDVATLSSKDLPGFADLAWASFPCQDLSLAGAGAGLKGERSGTYWPFWRLMKSLSDETRAPQFIVLENVCGMLTAHGGEDFRAICKSLAEIGYSFGAVVADAALFVPQSRPRLVIVAVKSLPLSGVHKFLPTKPWHTSALVRAYQSLDPDLKSRWVWWSLPLPSRKPKVLPDILDQIRDDHTWFSDEQVQKLLAMMSPLHRAKVEKAKLLGKQIVGSVYKRTRTNGGTKVQRAEVRFDGVSGCLRTPAGGSSRQIILFVEGKQVRARLISTRETARLMGLPDSYELPKNYNEGYHLTGDGVAVPVVRHIIQTIVEPALQESNMPCGVAA